MFGLEEELQDKIEALEKKIRMYQAIIIDAASLPKELCMKMLDYIQEGGGIEGSNVDRWYNNKYENQQLFADFMRNLHNHESI